MSRMGFEPVKDSRTFLSFFFFFFESDFYPSLTLTIIDPSFFLSNSTIMSITKVLI